MSSVCETVENIVGKAENAGCQHFLLFSQCFQKRSCPELFRKGIVWKRVKTDNDRELTYQYPSFPMKESMTKLKFYDTIKLMKICIIQKPNPLHSVHPFIWLSLLSK